MTARRLLYLDSHILSAYAWQGGTLVAEGSFSASPGDLARFSAYLQAYGRGAFQLLVNVGDEGHQLEVIPHLQGRDRRALIARKLGQVFFGTSLSTAISLGYEKTKRKNERLLLSALTNPARIEPWLDCLATAEVPLAGIYTLAQMGGQLLRRLHKLPERCLLLTMQDSSIRESYVVQGETLFSRRAPLADGSIAGIAATFAAEAAKLHQYLVGQRQIGRNDRLPTFVLAHPATVEAVQAACIGTGNLSYTVLDSHAAAARIGLRTAPQDSRSESLFLHLLAIAPPRQQFAGEDRRHHYRLLRIRQALLSTASVALLAALLFTAKQVYDSHGLRLDAADLRAQEQELSRRYGQIAATFPKLAVDNDALRQITDRFADLQRLRGEPGDAYRLVSRALTASPAIELDSIDWQIADAAGNGNAGLPSPVSARELMVVRGSIRLGQEATPRQFLSIFDAFVHSLRANPGVDVEMLQRPFDVGPGHILKGGDGAEGTSQARAFAVRIIRKPAS